ncbi:P-loop containing nucleoside triphosphate hydrolase protein [Halteromyces radiatus]|uniref:P-loop containing nucleoside triphosphate hydrolase protein n=1 Tax=Halteromyces radiatus TaxID=101107 RepID=UPI00221F5E29|nr:P-loop containing nucleoside triphosphate hydrolase protein [Halteromyces radiatus]KAI8086379.1 P-loop containing nucleoside triphosphate hydrolase protein [Halteromyces radiatus]
MQTTLPLHAAPGEATAHGPQGISQFRNLTLHDIESDPISQLAKKHYGGKSKPKWDPKLVEDIIETHLVSSNYDPKKIMLLEFTQYLEKYLWPYFDSETATLNHVLSICMIVNEKSRQRVSPWEIFSNDTAKFSALFDRVIHLAVPSESKTLPLRVQRIVLMFLILCFQSLENTTIRTECLKLVTIGIWQNLGHDDRREQILNDYPPVRKLWNSSNKKYNLADDNEKEKLDFNRNWLSALLMDFVGKIYEIPAEGKVDDELLMYCERFFELLIDLEAQLPTRRFFNTLLDDHQIVVLCKLAPFIRRDNKDVELMKQLLENLAFYAKFEINDQTGLALTDLDMTEQHSAQLIQLQHIIFRDYKDILPDLPLANLGSIEQRTDLLWHFEKASVDDLSRICDSLNIRGQPIVDSLITDGLVDKKDLLIESLVDKYQKRTSQIEKVNSSPLYPDEDTLFKDSLIQTQFYTGERPLALPKLNLQFLTIHDYLLRNFNLFRLESSYEIRQDIEDVIKRLGPRLTYPERTIEWSGWARMALPIDSFGIVDVGRPELGQDQPSRVTADVSFNVSKYSKVIRAEWDSLRKHDIVFLLTIRPHDDSATPYQEGQDFRKHFGIKYIRGAEIVDVIGNDGHTIDQAAKSAPEEKPFQSASATRTLRIALDPNQFKTDMQKHSHGMEDVHDTFNILVRRKPQENNFKAVLETIRDLMQSELVVPDWLQKVFLGYGDPASAHYSNLPSRLRELNFRDTFLNWDHLKQSLPDKVIQPIPDETAMVPPFILSHTQVDSQVNAKSKKKKSAKAMDVDTPETIQVSSYKVPNMGPYPQDIPKQNNVPFTPVQVESIHSGMNHGLTMVVGPPGTGKTDVAVQTIANLYHNHPNQHTLIVTHSNQALNQIFEKLMELDIDSRHLVRLGHGEEELNTELSFSKFGRVTSFLERRIELLKEVDRLSQSLEIPGEHGSTCETAGYFYNYHVKTRWAPYHDKITTDKNMTLADVRDEFPFAVFFANAPQPLFNDDMTVDDAIDVAQGCFRHLEKLFEELEDVRPFELLRYSTDRANYLITKEAKIIAMTCTHAALKRRELVSLKFKYDNVVMEEAAQILEVETFIPLLLQEPEDGENRLKRVILIGDHNQLPPVVKNLAFQQYGNMEQSLFTRFIRLGVPALQLDAQGRARSSLAKLYSWRYNQLGDLPNVLTNSEFLQANAGLTYDYQFINVGPYHGQGESEPVAYFYQNVGEAEYVVALYQYMRLIGYPAEKITILTTYNGQRSLINDVLQRRCAWNPFFGRPAAVSTVDQYQGQQNDYILLSLVRTKTVGHLRDVRRLIVAMSRARLGLYVFGRRGLFENCYELKPVFDQLLARPDKLCLQHNESYPTNRLVDVHKDITEMDHVEEMGKLVYKLSQEQLDEEMIRQEQIQEAEQEAEELIHQEMDDAQEN